MHKSALLEDPFGFSVPLTPFSPFPIFGPNINMFHKSGGSTDSSNSQAYRRRDATPISSDYEVVKKPTTSPTSRAEPRQRVRSNSMTPGHTVVATADHNKRSDRNTWSGSAPAISRNHSTSTIGRNRSQTNLHQTPSNSPVTATNIQRTFSNQSTHIAPTLSRRYSKSSSKRRPILFYHKHEPHYGFTNFSNHAVKYYGKVYPTSEHLFQSLKVCILLRSTSNPSDTADQVRPPSVVG